MSSMHVSLAEASLLHMLQKELRVEMGALVASKVMADVCLEQPCFANFMLASHQACKCATSHGKVSVMMGRVL